MAQLSEVGVFGGTTLFMGDVGNAIMPQGYVVGGIYRFQFNEYYSVRFQGMYGKTAGQDAQATSDFKVNRNQSFESTIIEGAAMIEFNFFEYVTGSKKMSHSPYIFAGVGVFKFNPQGIYNGSYYDLQPLGTEGQGTSLNNDSEYGLLGLNIPFGLGYRISIGNSTSLAFEVGFRNTSTDYLDDVSKYYVDKNQLANEKGDIAAYFSDRSITDTDKTGTMRGSSDRNDWYTFAGVSLFVALTPPRERCTRF